MIARFFKKLLWAVIIFIALDASLVLALPKIISMDKVAVFLQDKVRELTGRDLAFSDVHISLWPNLGVELSQVTLSNPAWAQEKNMVTLGKAEVELELMPLLDHHIVVKKFILNEPVIYLETSADGQHNWDFSQEIPALAANDDENNTTPQHRKSVPEPEHSQFDLQFGRIQITKGNLIFTDQQKKTTSSIEDADIDATLPDLKSPLHVKGAATYRNKRLTLDVGLDRPLDFFNGRASSGQISLQADDFTVKADGSFATQGTLLKGDIDASTPALAEVLAWARNTPERKLPFEKISFTGEARLTNDEIILQKANLALDVVKASGDLDVEFAAKPVIFARLSVQNKLNLDRFTGGSNEAPAPPAPSGEAKPAVSSGNNEAWDTKPLDFSGLNTVNADLKLQTQGFSLRGTEVGPSALAVQLADGNLHFTSSEASLAGGKFASDLRVNAASATPSISFAFNTAGVQAQPILATFAHFKKLSGSATAHVSLTATGDSQKAIISSLAGNGDVDFKNGALEGIDLIKITKLVQQHSTDVGVDEGTTKFVDVTGTFSIEKGIISNTDMKMKGAVVLASGQGIVDLPKKYIQYKATPVLVTASNAPPAISVPLKITGPFDHIKIVPDFATTVKSILKNPSGAKALLKNIGDNIKQNAVLQKFLQSGSSLLNKLSPSPPPAPAAPSDSAPEPQQ